MEIPSPLEIGLFISLSSTILIVETILVIVLFTQNIMLPIPRPYAVLLLAYFIIFMTMSSEINQLAAENQELKEELKNVHRECEEHNKLFSYQRIEMF